MAVTRIPAQDVTVEVNTGTIGVPTWTPIGGLVSIALSESETEIDTTNMDSGATDEHKIIRRGKECGLEGQYYADPTNGARDPGQAKVEALARAVLDAAEGQFRIRVIGADAETFTGTARSGEIGGGHNDMLSWQYTVKRTGASVIAP